MEDKITRNDIVKKYRRRRYTINLTKTIYYFFNVIFKINNISYFHTLFDI